MTLTHAMSNSSPGLSAADRLQMLEHELIVAQRRALLGETSAMLAHEFNNLMTPILARASFALSTDDRELHVQTLERIVAQVNKALDLSRQLLSLSSENQDSSGQCAVHAVIESALQDTVRPLKKDGIDTDVQMPADLQAQGSSVLLEQVLLNLVLNARAALQGQRGRIAISARNDDGFIEIDVHDSGCGMDAQQQAVLQEFLADRSTELIPRPSGVGLGLQLCRLIVTQQGGALRMSDSPMGGCQFTVRWPAADASPAES